MKFSDYWKMENHGIMPFEKERLSKVELVQVRDTIAKLQAKGLPSSKIIEALQKMNSKLSEKWKAERAFWTESKREDSAIVGDAGDDLGIDKYRVILSPNPCPICVKKTNNGSRVFKTVEVEKTGYGHIPPFHPNCYCILVPSV